MFLFSLKGRASRLEFWLIMLGLAVASALLFWGSLNIFGHMLGPQALWVPVVLWMSFAVQVRRVHDRGKAWWWGLIFWLGPNVLNAPFSASENVVTGALALAGVALAVWAIVELGFLPGTPGENRYGTPKRT